MLRRLALVLATTLLLPCALSNEALTLDGEAEAEAQDRELFLLNLLKKTDDGRTYDFIIVGSGPAGCLLAKYLTDSGEDTVLLLEAGSDDDNDKTIRDGNNIVSPELFGLKYFWQEPAKFNPRSQGDSQIVGGKSLGGGTSVNGMQWVWPSKGFMQEMSQASGHDPDWSVKSIQDAIREVEAYQGKSENPKARGYEGIIPVTQRPADRQASGAGLRLLEAFKHVTKLPELEDYNNPDTPVGPWLKWQQNRDQHNKRASASVRFLSHEVRARPNLVIKTKCLVNRVTFEGTRAGGVEFKEGIHTKTAKANKEVIVSAGVHSAPILERSGVGNQHIIGKVLKAAKKPFVAHVPGVGEGFGSDGGHLLFFTHNPKDRVDNVDFFRSGAYFPYPGRDPNAPGSPRFTQWFGFGPLKILPLTFQVYVDMYNVSSRGSVHIKSANAIHSAEWDTGLFSNPEDLKNLVRVFREQVLPVADSLRANGGGFYKLVSPPRHLLTNKDDKPLIRWLKTKYIKGYHYFGATAMRPLSKGGVVDSDCKVYGVTGLRVVDVSIMPVKPDSNTQIYSYFAGVIAAKKILREYAKPVITYSEAVDEEEEGDEEGEGIIYEEEEGEEEAGAEEEEEEGDEE